MKYKVIKPCTILYGNRNEAWMHLNKGQVWELRDLPSKCFKWYSLSRYSMTINIGKEYFMKVFEPLEESEEQT